MSKRERGERVQTILLEMYRLGRDYEAERPAQVTDEQIDGLGEYVARVTTELEAEALALVAA